MKRLFLTVCAFLLVCGVTVAGCQATPSVPEYNGAMLFMGYCASCHGPSGGGDGPLAPSLITAMEDLQTIQVRNDGVFPRERLTEQIDGRGMRAAHGTPDMPVWGWQFRAVEGTMEAEPELYVKARVDALVDYLESIQQKN